MAAQLPDIIFLQGKEMDLYTNPLENYWVSAGKKKPEFEIYASCKRGYVATWAIEHNDLILIDIQGRRLKSLLFFNDKYVDLSIKNVFPKSKGKGVLANWFSGKLRIPAGNMTQYEHYDYNSRFEKEIIMTVEKGKVLKIVTLDYTQQKLVVNLENIL